MVDNSKIEWTDATWNPVTGCTEVTPGCDHCYAKTFAERWRGVPGHHFERGFDVVLRPERLDQPLRWKKPRRIFVNSMSDLFHDEIPDAFIAEVFAVMAQAEQHTFQVLTKRHGRMRALLNSDDFLSDLDRQLGGNGSPASLRAEVGWPLPNVWLGVSVENQKWADIRIPALLHTPAAVRFLSCEPLLGPVDIINGLGDSWMTGVDWVIVGGESGRGARAMNEEWVRSLRDQCEVAGVPFLFKQWGSGSLWADRHGDVWAYGADGLMHTAETAPFPREHVEKKWGPLRPLSKTAAGRELDGRTWNEFPQSVSA